MASLQAFLSFLPRSPRALKFPLPLPLLTPATQAIFDLARGTFSTRCIKLLCQTMFQLDEQIFIHCRLFISFDAWTSTLHFTEIRTLYSILTRRISPVTASYFKLNLVYFQLNCGIFVYALVIIGRDKISLCGGWRWRPIGLHPRLFRPSCFVKKGIR